MLVSMMPFDVTFVFSQNEVCLNSPVSKYLNLPASEKTVRPIYYVEKQVEVFGREWQALYLVLFFSINPGYAIATKNVGYHEADVEKIIVLRDKDTLAPKHVYFGAHGNGEGMWVPWDKCKKDTATGSSLMVYISPTSHGLYPHPTTYYRMLGFANDKCDGKGEIWKPKPEDFEHAAKQTWSQTHFQVKRGINSPLNSPDPAVTSITPTQRFFLVFPQVRNKVKRSEKIKVIRSIE